MGIVSISLPDSLLEQADALIEARGFAGRSEVVRAALREFIVREAQSPLREGTRSATLTLVYPEGHERRVAEIRHAFNDTLKSMIHTHAPGSCVEVFMLHGKAARVREFADSLRAYRESRLVELVYTDVDLPLPPGSGRRGP